MTIQAMKDNLELVKNKYLLCRFMDAFRNYDFTQVCLEIISEEADIVLKQQPYFDTNSQGNFCYVKFDNFKEFIQSSYEDVDYLNEYMTAEEEEEFISDFLENKLILIKPYFYYNQSRNVFFKNGTVVDIFDCDERKNCSYFTIPTLPTPDSFKSLIKNKEFALTSVPKSLMGIPNYLYYDRKIYMVDIDTIKANENFWKTVLDNSVRVLDIDYEGLVNSQDLIIGDDYKLDMDFIFVRKDSIIGSLLKEIATDFEEESKPEESYDSTGSDKIINDFYSYTKNQNLCYTKNDINNFYTCVTSGQLVILAGMSGTGKTRLPLKFAEYFNMSEENNSLLFLPVSPSFVEPADILGFLNPNTNTYVASETRLVEFLIDAEKNPNKMHMVILDEMNLAQIEFWFAPFISLLEKDITDRKLHLYSSKQECKNKKNYPPCINIGRNVIFIGTINLDETTKDISDRLIDRSYIINLKKESFMNYQAQQASKNIEVKTYDGDILDLIPTYEANYNYIVDFDIRELEFFDKVHALLNDLDSQKGISFRSVKNISVYLKNKPKEFDKGLAFDYAFKQTVMKKINGSVDAIGDLLGYLDDNKNPVGELTQIFDEYNDISDFNECRTEVKNKILELKKYGYAR